MASNKIKVFREQKKLTVKDLAQKSGLSEGYISLLENNNRKNPTQGVMEKIAEALGKSVQAVFFSKN